MRIGYFFLLLALTSLLACSRQKSELSYDFNNLTNKSQQEQLAADLEKRGVTARNRANLDTYIKRYNQENKGYQAVVSNWTPSKLGQDQNEFITFQSEETFKKNSSYFPKDLNCRRTSFLLLHNLITSSKDMAKLGLEENPEFISLSSQVSGLTQTDEQLYSLLFNDNPSYQSIEDRLKDWKKAGLVFPKDVKLVSIFQNTPGDVSNFHTALAYEKDGDIYLFEKQDPTLPYRWSQFHSWADIKSHWLGNRFKVFSDSIAILVNDQPIEHYIT